MAKTVSPAVISPKNGEVGYRPVDLHGAYELPTTASTTQTIALVDAFNDPTAEADLNAYSKEFEIPECTAALGCFSQVSQSASEPLPFPKSTVELERARHGSPAEREMAAEATGWGGEISLDIEVAHAICQNCHILLVEAKSNEYSDLEAAESRAETLGAKEISNSWGGMETPGIAAQEIGGPFNHAKTVITASAGDNGYLNWAEAPEQSAEYPSSSPHVVAVGGTRLELGAQSKWAGERVWNGYGAGGGGCSASFAAPEWQLSLADWPEVGCATRRSVADVSADADPYTGVAVRFTGGGCSFERETSPGVNQTIAGWCPIGGTSLASPLIAAVFGLAGGAQEVPYPAKTLYEGERNVAGALHDITEGSNGSCAAGFDELTGLSYCSAAQEAQSSCPLKAGSCMACPRYDGPTGVGTPKGIAAFAPTTPPVTESSYDPAWCKVEAPSAQPASKESVAETPVVPPAAAPTPPPTAPPPARALPSAQLTKLALTRSSLVALKRRPTGSKVAFAFTVNVDVRVRVALSRQVRSHGRTRWVAAAAASSISAVTGRDVKRLSGSRRLAPGIYRLTLTPSSGTPRSIVFRIR